MSNGTVIFIALNIYRYTHRSKRNRSEHTLLKIKAFTATTAILHVGIFQYQLKVKTLLLIVNDRSFKGVFIFFIDVDICRARFNTLMLNFTKAIPLFYLVLKAGAPTFFKTQQDSSFAAFCDTIGEVF